MFGPDGAIRATATLPAVQITEIGVNHVIGVWLDPDGVPSVRVHTLVKWVAAGASGGRDQLDSAPSIAKGGPQRGETLPVRHDSRTTGGIPVRPYQRCGNGLPRSKSLSRIATGSIGPTHRAATPAGRSPWPRSRRGHVGDRHRWPGWWGVWAVDYANARYSRFDKDGPFAGRQPRPLSQHDVPWPGEQASGGSWTWIAGASVVSFGRWCWEPTPTGRPFHTFTCRPFSNTMFRMQRIWSCGPEVPESGLGQPEAPRSSTSTCAATPPAWLRSLSRRRASRRKTAKGYAAPFGADGRTGARGQWRPIPRAMPRFRYLAPQPDGGLMVVPVVETENDRQVLVRPNGEVPGDGALAFPVRRRPGAGGGGVGPPRRPGATG